MFSAGSPPSRNSSKTEMDPIESCQQFVAITGASQDEALNWLEMTGYVLQDAVDLFFNSGGANHTTGSSAPALRGQHKHSFDDSYEDDENVRAPDKVKRQKLVNTEAYLATQVSKNITSAFTSGKSKKNMSEKEKTLSQIFQAPLDIMTQSGFEEVKELAKSEDKWLLVNIQKDSEFQSHALNRDFWSDECVKDMIMCSFVFWQQQDVSPEGRTFISYYKVTSFPHVAIVDPRTGACKWQYKFIDTLKPKLLAEKLQDFLGDNPAPSQCRRLPGGSSDSSSSMVVSGGSSSRSGAGAGGGAAAGGGAEDVRCGGDAELEEAIRLSLQQQENEHQPAGTSTITSSSSSASGSASTGNKQAAHKPGFCVREVLERSVAQDDAAATDAAADGEAAAGPSIRSQFRLPGNQKITEKFNTSDTVYTLISAVAKQIPAADVDKRFEVHFNFPRQNLSDLLHQHASRDEAGRVVGADEDAKTSAGSAGRTELRLSDLGINTDTAFHVIFL